MLRRGVTRLARAVGGPNPTLRTGQLDNRDLEWLVASIAARESWGRERHRIVVEVGTGGGRGSTAAIHRALTARGCPFQLIGYEGDAELAALAARHWRGVDDVRVVNEYFMHREDIDLRVKPRVAPGDREAYFSEFEAVARKENFLATPPDGPVDLLFIDSVRYTHLAILSAAAPWLRSETVVLMEDDVPGYGELAIVESEFELLDVAHHEIAGHQWPFVEFRIEPGRE